MTTEKTTTAESLLGLLTMCPMSGLQIKQLIEQSIGNFWNESFGQIYPTLKRLERQGLVRGRSSPGTGEAGRPSRIYELTDAGRVRLHEWLGLPVRPQVMRNELLLKLFFGDQVSLSTAVTQVSQAKARFEAELGHYRGIAEALPKLHPRAPGLPFWLMTVRYGIAEATAHLQWASDTLEQLNLMKIQQSRSVPNVS